MSHRQRMLSAFRNEAFLPCRADEDDFARCGHVHEHQHVHGARTLLCRLMYTLMSVAAVDCCN